MTIAENWTPITWHCTSCGNKVTGYKNPDGDIRVECGHCKTVMVRKLKGRRRATMEIFLAPKQQAI